MVNLCFFIFTFFYSHPFETQIKSILLYRTLYTTRQDVRKLYVPIQMLVAFLSLIPLRVLTKTLSLVVPFYISGLVLDTVTLPISDLGPSFQLLSLHSTLFFRRVESDFLSKFFPYPPIVIVCGII